VKRVFVFEIANAAPDHSKTHGDTEIILNFFKNRHPNKQTY